MAISQSENIKHSLPVAKESLQRLAAFRQTVSLIWQACKGWTLAWGGLLVILGILPVAIVYLSKLMVDGLVGLAGTGGDVMELIRPVAIQAALMALIILLSELLQGSIEWVRAAQSEFVQDHVTALVHKKSSTLDLAFYESPEYYDHLYRARTEASSRSLALLENVGSFLQNGITLASMATILIPYGLWLPPVLLISAVPALLVVLYFDRRYHNWWKLTTADRRWVQYYDSMLTHNATAAELRMFDLSATFAAAYQRMRKPLRDQNLRLTRDQSLARMGAATMALAFAGGTMAWMGWRVCKGMATLGDLALFYQVFNRGQSLMRALLGNLGKIYTNSVFMDNLFEFLHLQPQIVSPPEPLPVPAPLKKGISFIDVRFGYPGSSRTAMDDFTLHIPAGRIVAIVGPNGAGKSTLVKLLCRFYDPQEGRIEMDGKDISKLALGDLRRQITVLLQTPVFYHASAADNIAYGDVESEPSRDMIESAAQGAGADETISRLPSGYDTLLGKWFANGVELSAGEWQRVSLARAFFRKAQIILLDEPTSFMDSWAEAEWFERLRTLADGRTAIIITHRFTIAMRADIIHVMNNGGVAESGTHKELLSRGGLYAQSWNAQMRTQDQNVQQEVAGVTYCSPGLGCSAQGASEK